MKPQNYFAKYACKSLKHQSDNLLLTQLKPVNKTYYTVRLMDNL